MVTVGVTVAGTDAAGTVDVGVPIRDITLRRSTIRPRSFMRGHRHIMRRRPITAPRLPMIRGFGEKVNDRTDGR